MIDVNPEVLKALKKIISVKVFFNFPPAFMELPCISYYEARNAPCSAADDDEYMSEIVFIVDVWGESSKKVNDIAIKADEVMKEVGFRREFACDIANGESNIRQKNMRFILKR